jgi:glycosyl hydrolase family 123
MNICDNSSGQRSTEHVARSTFRRVKGLPSAAAVLVVLAILMTAGQATGSTFPVWVSPRLVRVGPTDAPGTTTSINVYSGRGETIATQVIVQAPSGGLTNVNVSASALSGPSGATIAASNITLYREFYVTVNGTTNYGGGSNPPLDSGTYPEPLIPFNDPQSGAALCGTSAALKACNASVVTGQNQPYWIDIFVPRGRTNSPPGTYTGSVSVTADQGSATIPVTLTVWNFELPMQPSELSVWSLWPPATITGNIDTDIINLAQALMRNKLMYRVDIRSNAAADITTFGLNRSGLDYYFDVSIQCNGSYNKIPSTSEINLQSAGFPAGLPLDLYVGDELNNCPAAYPPLKTMGTNAHAANPIVKTTVTMNTPDPNLYDEGDGRSAVDHWVLLDSMQQWPSLPWSGPGDLWSYTSCNAGSGNTPEWMTDYPPINERIQAGFLNWTESATGILYYRVDGWNAGNTLASWNNLNVTACFGNSRPGDGMFLYPPAPIGSSEEAPGIRLKAIRDGVQDYEYAHLLHTLGQDAFVNATLQPIAASWTNWTHDPNALENARQSLGQELNQLGPP